MGVMSKKKIKRIILKYRTISLLATFIITLIIALLLAYFVADFLCWIGIEDEANIIFRGLLYSLPPLPLFFLLWFYRHTDTQEIIHQNALFEAQRLILEPDSGKKSVAIAQLKKLLINVSEFEGDIYIALKGGLQQDAEWKNPEELRANLSKVNLNRVNLQGANLQGANLRRANLQKANLQGAILYEADLQQANLQGANLQRATKG